MNSISAVILAAGKSARMGQQKLLMPWGDTTVLGRVITVLRDSQIADIVLVTNSKTAADISPDNLQIILNNDGEMLTSLQLGLRAVKPSAQAALICLGDQPQIEEGSVRSISAAYLKNQSSLVVPSYQMRRGHPWLAARTMWDEILSLEPGSSMRSFLNAHAGEIEYVNLDTATVLQDLDTPEDYLKYKPSL
ncbi:hypothetical protein MASR2M66_08250 [Chloroflexota bacterium]